jgi:hypothetical protein
MDAAFNGDKNTSERCPYPLDAEINKGVENYGKEEW